MNITKGSKMMIDSVLEILDKHINEEEIIKIVTDLVSIPSYVGIKNQEANVAEYIHDLFIREGIPAELIHVQDGRKNVIATLKGKGKEKSLLLTGHTDTVPPYDMKDALVPRREGDKLIGRGSTDRKGPLACMAMALIILKRAAIMLEGDLIFAGVIDEEEKSLGTIDLIEKGIKADGAIVGEPSDLAICLAHRGLEWLEFEIIGKTVHGGRQKEGINAILKASDLIQYMEDNIIPELDKKIHPLTGTATMNYGTIAGGTQPSTVAGNCKLTIDRRWIPGEDYEIVLKEYTDALAELHKKDPQFKCEMKIMDVSVMKEGYVHEAMEIDVDHKLVLALSEASKTVKGQEAQKTYFPAWSDGGLLERYAEIPTIVCGPGFLEVAHSKDEYIDVKQLVPAVKIYALTAIKFCDK
jgi:acetylornithine deacetylase/succinyl-diaminopimelate desuccinylase family protein